MGCHVIIWEYRVPAASESAFLEHYGPDGSWARLFRRAEGWIDTRLLRDASVAGRYVTVDRWESAAAFAKFRALSGHEYEALDRQCEALTEAETPLGSFAEVEPGGA